MSKVSGFDGYKPCHVECEWTEGYCVDIATVQKTHFTYAADCRMLKDDYVVFSSYGSRSSVGVYLLIGRCLNADVNLVIVVNGGRLFVADAAVKMFEFQVVAASVTKIVLERVSLFSAVRAVHQRSETGRVNG